MCLKSYVDWVLIVASIDIQSFKPAEPVREQPSKIDEEAAPHKLPFKSDLEAAPSGSNLGSASVEIAAMTSSGSVRPVRKCRFY